MFGSSLSPVVKRGVHVLLWCLCLFAHSDVQHFVLSNAIMLCIPCCDASHDFLIKTLFAYSGVQHILCCVVFFCLACLRLVTCVPNVASFSGMSILGFSNFYYNWEQNCHITGLNSYYNTRITL